MEALVNLFIALHTGIGDSAFVPVMAVLALVLSLKLIPVTTDMMVNSAAGLAGRHIGMQYRTLVINCSTNNPEVATMIVSLLLVSGVKRFGGIGTPLGSNLANIYLIFLVALGWVLGQLWLKNRSGFSELIELLKRERKLVAWHLTMSLLMFCVAGVAFRLLTGQFPIGGESAEVEEPKALKCLLAAGLCVGGVVLFLLKDRALRSVRPELFEDIDDEDHESSWQQFWLGTLELVVCCTLINAMFDVATRLYGATLAGLLGPAVFAVLHYFVGALVTSLPEMNVAINNYRRIQPADLNTALSSSSASNMSNLAIAALGCMLAALL